LRGIPGDYTERPLRERPLRIVIMTAAISVASQSFKFRGAIYHDRQIEIA
jgi:hypothetical protein